LFGKVTASVDIKGSVSWNELCPNYKSLGSAQVLLDDGHTRSANVHRDGAFILPDVSSGNYMLSVRAHDHVFEQVVVQVSQDGNNISKILPYIPGTVITTLGVPNLPYPIRISAVSRHNYFVPHESFNLLAMFGNPMMLMTGIGAILLFATPYLTKLVDPEGLKEGQGKPSLTTDSSALVKGQLPPNKEEKTNEIPASKAPSGRRQTPTSNTAKGRSNKIRRK